jgi:vancomycin resistance protein YoaR
MVFALIIFSFTPFLVYNLSYTGRIFPKTFIAGADVSGSDIDEASNILASTFKIPEKIKLTGSGQDNDLNPRDFDANYNFVDSATRAYNLVRTGNIIFDLYQRVYIIEHPANLGLSVDLNEDKLTKIISVIAAQNSTDPVYPDIKLTNGNILVNKGSPGTEADQKTIRALIGSALSLPSPESIKIPVKTIDPTLSDEEVKAASARAEKFIGKSIKAKFEFDEYNFKDADILSLLDPKGGFKPENVSSSVSKIAVAVDRDPQNPKFAFDGGKVTEFQPSLDGIKTKTDELAQSLIESINKLELEGDKQIVLEIPVARTKPEVATGQTNNLGIKELIGRGTSTYFHSIPSRVHNVSVATARINGTLVKPGEIFSFNKTLGDVSQFTSYQQAYIISGGKTILGDGGGVCQVSSTLFRAILNAGLPVNERQAHAYRVGYYEQNSPPGFDATVYSPSPDLKFENDTGNYILIVAKADPKRYSLIFELYGASDGRVGSTTKPVVANVIPAPDDLYQDDPSLPAGTTKQIDFRAAGAKVTFNYSVKRNGEVIYKKTFISNYRPWQAVYLRGTGPAI